MFEEYQLAPKEEDEMEDFRDYDDEHSELGSKLDEYSDEEAGRVELLQEVGVAVPHGSDDRNWTCCELVAKVVRVRR